jgi:hypothetical protein
MQLDAGVNLNAVKGNSILPAHLTGYDISLKGSVIFVSHDPIPDGDIVIIRHNLPTTATITGGFLLFALHITSQLTTLTILMSALYKPRTVVAYCLLIFG